jgi:hypothetical protein
MDAITKLESAHELFMERCELLKRMTLKIVVVETFQSHSLWRFEGPVPQYSIAPPYVGSRWEILFQNCIGYLVEDEAHYSICMGGGEWVGNRLRTYSKSTFIDFMRSIKPPDHDLIFGKTSHYCVVMDDLVVDVLAGGEPEVRELDPYLP